MQIEDIDLRTVLKEGCVISGGRGSGKTTLAFHLVEKMRDLGINFKVIDSSLAWRLNSSVQYYQQIKYNYQQIIDLEDSIYDFSRLSCYSMRKMVTSLLTLELQKAIDETSQEIKKPLIFVLEEIQNLLPNNSFRSLDNEPISRFITQGRNFQRSYLGITQRLASTDTSLVEISGLKIIGKTEGENNLRKLKAWLPKDVIKELPNLRLGEFFIQYGSSIKRLETKPFKQLVKPQNYEKVYELYKRMSPIQETPIWTLPKKNPSFFTQVLKTLIR